MTKKEFRRATELAISRDELPIPLGKFDGFGLPDFTPIYCTLRELAGLIRWQCVWLNGVLGDTEAHNEVWANRRKFILLEESCDMTT